MMQIYFLSVTLTGLSGIILASDVLGEKFSSFATLQQLLAAKELRLTVAVLTGIVALVSLLYMSPDTIPILSDLLPALTGIFMAVTLFFEHFKKSDEQEGRNIDDPELHPLIRYKALTGFAGFLVAFIHFLIPSALIL